MLFQVKFCKKQNHIFNIPVDTAFKNRIWKNDKNTI